MKKIIVISILVIGVIVFLQYGRKLYMPLTHKIKGKETTASVIAKIEKVAWSRLEDKLHDVGFSDYPQQIILVAFKEERILELYAQKEEDFKLIKKYPFTAFSGKLGPKLKEGDKQIPEGVYKVEYLNPNSSYYLSIKVDYPNKFDQSKTQFTNKAEMGGDIFIHGKSVTIGCIPIGDEAIEEVFLLTQKAQLNNVRIIISPRDFRINPQFPQIENINWEKELYDSIKTELEKLPI